MGDDDDDAAGADDSLYVRAGRQGGAFGQPGIRRSAGVLYVMAGDWARMHMARKGLQLEVGSE